MFLDKSLTIIIVNIFNDPQMFKICYLKLQKKMLCKVSHKTLTNEFSFYYNEIFISYISISKHMNNIKQSPFNMFQQKKCISFCVLLPNEINLINLVEMLKKKVSIQSFISF